MSNNGINNNKFAWIKNKYGSKKGFVYSFYYRLLNLFNKYSNYHCHDLSSVTRVIFICKGNVCRSAYAEAFAKKIGLNAISCGIDALDSAPANKNAMKVAKQKGIELENHKTTPLLNVDFKDTDILLVMEPYQAEVVSELLNGKYAVSLLGLWSKPELPYIHDPYSSSLAYFETCFNTIEKSVYGIRNKIS